MSEPVVGSALRQKLPSVAPSVWSASQCTEGTSTPAPRRRPDPAPYAASSLKRETPLRRLPETWFSSSMAIVDWLSESTVR